MTALSLPEALLGIASRSVSSVFEAYGQRLQEVQRTGPGAPALGALARQAGFEPPFLAASVGFRGPKIRGELLLASSLEVIAHARPSLSLSSSPHSATNQILARDWMAELANQALGLFKNRLRKCDIAFEAGAPNALSGAPVAALSPRTDATQFILFRCAGGALWCGLDVACAFEMDPRLTDNADSDDEFTSFAD